MTDEEKQYLYQQEKEIIDEIERLRDIVNKSELLIAELYYHAEQLKTWRVLHDLKKDQWIVGKIKTSPSSFYGDIQIVQKYGPEAENYVKARLLKVNSHKFTSDAERIAWVNEYCTKETSNEHFVSALATLKGLHDPLACSCQSLQFFTRCTTCGKVKKDALSPKE